MVATRMSVGLMIESAAALIDPDTEYRFVTATFEIATRGN
jgi:hypothetical protein